MTSSLERRARKFWGKNGDEIRALIMGRMPGFVLGAKAPHAEIPVFTFHDVDPAGFEHQLSHLRHNDYRTIDANELADGGQAERRVVLTFDDATWSFWAYAYPLLQRYDLRAVLFVVPGMVREADAPRPNLEDAWKGFATLADVREAAGHEPFCTWPEIEHMHESGCVDVQSHSLTHSRMPVSPRVLDFLHPGFDSYAGGFNIPVSSLDTREGRRVLRPGAPVFESTSRLAGRLRFLEDPELVEDLIMTAEQKGIGFFDRAGWRRDLRRVLARRPSASRGRYESGTEREAALRRELVESRRRIEARLPGHFVRHLSYPWHEGSALTDSLAADIGYRSVHYGASLDEREPGAGSPVRVRRLPDRYLLRLPGSGRASLLTALASSRNHWEMP